MRLLPPFLVSAALACGLAALVVPAAAQTTAPPPAIAPTPEIQAVVDEARKLEVAQKFDDAARLYQDALPKAQAAMDRKGEGVLLFRLGNLVVRKNQANPAIELFEKALVIGRELNDALILGYSLKGIGVAQYRLGEPQKAVEFWASSIPFFQTLGDRANEAGTRMNMGVVLDNTGDPKKALEVYGLALPVFVALGDRVGNAHCLLNMAVARGKLGESDRSFELYQQAQALYHELNMKGDEANALLAIGGRYRTLGEVKKAIECFNQGLTLSRETGSKLVEGAALANLATSYADFGQSEKALGLYRESLALKRATGDPRGEAATLSAMGSLLNRTGRTREGLEALEQALPLFRRVGNRTGEANALLRMGLAYGDIRQDAESESSFEQSRTIFKQLADRVGEADVLNGMAGLLQARGKPREAAANYLKALETSQALGQKYATAALLGNLAGAYSDLHQVEKARLYYLQALPLFRALGDQHGIANTMNGLGELSLSSDDPAGARYYFREAVTAARAAGNRGYEAVFVNHLGDAELKLGAVKDSTAHYARTVGILEGMRSNFAGYTEAKASLLAARIEYYYDYLQALLKANRNAEAFSMAQKTKARSLLDLLESGRVDLDASLTPEERAQQQDLTAQASSLNAAMVQQGVENEVGSKRRYAALKAQLQDVETQLSTLTARLYARHPELAAKRIARTATLDQIGRMLPPDTALLDYVVVAKDDVRVFVVTDSGGKPRLAVRKISRDYAALDKAAEGFHAACADPRKPFRPLSRQLNAILLEPAEDLLRGKSRLVICPDGALWDVPFAALSPGRGGRFAGERFALAYAYSATGAQAALTLAARPRKATSGSILVAANPAFGASERFGDLKGLPGQRPIDSASRPIDSASRPIDSASRPIDSASRPIDSASRPIDSASRPIDSASRPIDSASRPIDSASRPIDIASRAFDTVSRPLDRPSRDLQSARGKAIPPLPGTQREAEQLRKLFPDAKVLTGAAAQEGTVKQLAGDYRFLHLATHGFVNDGSPLLSSVVLADPKAEGAAKPNEDGFLTAREIYGLRLNAEMTVLSACNTARGENRTGEGVIGLTWALFVAGCPTQVVSQWAVDDAGTALLMGRFYENLRGRHLGKAQALREAESWLRTRNRKFAHPYYWAPFVLNGAWD